MGEGEGGGQLLVRQGRARQVTNITPLTASHQGSEALVTIITELERLAAPRSVRRSPAQLPAADETYRIGKSQ